MELDTEHEHGPSILWSHKLMTGGSKPDPDQQVSTKDSSGADPDLEEGVVRAGTMENREKRLPTHMRSFN